tara:strand:- start:549 stop:827 length:279 start_codon:yes stop_codon:yes gene_type:complete
MIELSNFIGQPCQSRIAYEFLPKKGYKLNLEKTTTKLRENEVFIELESPYLIMLKILGTNVSLFKSGKIIVKNTNEKKEARKVAEKLISKMQ